MLRSPTPGWIVVLVMVPAVFAGCTTGNYLVHRSAFEAATRPPVRGPLFEGAPTRTIGGMVLSVRPLGDDRYAIGPTGAGLRISARILEDEVPWGLPADTELAMDRVAVRYFHQKAMVPALTQAEHKRVLLLPTALPLVAGNDPSPWLPVRTRVRNARMIVGGPLIGAGALVVIGGGFMLSSLPDCGMHRFFDVDLSASCNLSKDLSIVTIVVGAALALAGVALISSGAVSHPERVSDAQAVERYPIPETEDSPKPRAPTPPAVLPPVEDPGTPMPPNARLMFPLRFAL